MAKRGSVTAGSESRTSISWVGGNGSRADYSGERSRHTSESPSNSRPESRAKRTTPSPRGSRTRIYITIFLILLRHTTIVQHTQIEKPRSEGMVAA